jgi:hypothetical protein
MVSPSPSAVATTQVSVPVGAALHTLSPLALLRPQVLLNTRVRWADQHLAVTIGNLNGLTLLIIRLNNHPGFGSFGLCVSTAEA